MSSRLNAVGPGSCAIFSETGLQVYCDGGQREWKLTNQTSSVVLEETKTKQQSTKRSVCVKNEGKQKQNVHLA